MIAARPLPYEVVELAISDPKVEQELTVLEAAAAGGYGHRVKTASRRLQSLGLEKRQVDAFVRSINKRRRFTKDRARCAAQTKRGHI